MSQVHLLEDQNGNYHDKDRIRDENHVGHRASDTRIEMQRHRLSNLDRQGSNHPEERKIRDAILRGYVPSIARSLTEHSERVASIILATRTRVQGMAIETQREVN